MKKDIDKQKEIDLYSKKRYILIDKETNTPLSYKNRGRWNIGSYIANNADLNVYMNIAVFDKPFPLDDLAKDTKNNEYCFVNHFSTTRHKNYKIYKNYIKARDKVVWKRLPKKINITRIDTSPYKIDYVGDKIKLINIKK